MAGLPSENDSVALVSEMFMALPSLGGESTIKNYKIIQMGSSKSLGCAPGSGLAQAGQQGVNLRQVRFAFRFAAAHDQVHQCIVRQVQQARERLNFFVRQASLVRIQEAREDQVVFKQAAAASPAQARAIGRV